MTTPGITQNIGNQTVLNNTPNNFTLDENIRPPVTKKSG
jgi:hypothetical protein